VGWDKLLAVVAVFLKALEQYAPTLMAYMAGGSVQRAKDAQRELSSVEKANHAAAQVELLPTDDVVRQLHERRLYRLRSK